LARPKAKTKSAAPKASDKGYKDHGAGSRKVKVHELDDKQGADAAWTLGIQLGLKEGTLRSWFGAWKRAGGRNRRSHQRAANRLTIRLKPLTPPSGR